MASRESGSLEGAVSLQTAIGRLDSFHLSHTVKDKNASTNKKRATATATWPHKSPGIELLATSGFYYKPTFEYRDSTKCFSCNVCVDGWEETDDPVDVHYQFSPQCAWAIHMAIGRRLRNNGEEIDNEADPMAEELVDARTSTFGDSWPYEGKRGWKCKVKKLVEAGWCYDPSPEYNDGVRCFYCDLMLDGWEPKDDPHAEHLRRRPDCPFFVLKDKFAAEKKQMKGKKGRTSRLSKASRLSTASVGTTFSEAPSMMSLGDDGAMSDDSVMTTATTASKAPKGRKTAKGRTTGTRKTSRSTKAKATVDGSQLDDFSTAEANDILYPDLLQVSTAETSKPKRNPRKGAVDDSIVPLELSVADEMATEPAPAKKGRSKKATKKADESQLEVQTYAAFDSSVMESQSAAPVKPKRGRAKKGAAKADESMLDTQSQAIPRSSDAQNVVVEVAKPKRGRTKKATAKEEESQVSMNYEVLGESSIMINEVPEAPKTKRGTKRSSNGAVKVDSSTLVIEEPVEEVTESKPKRARTRKAQPESESQLEDADTQISKAKLTAKSTKKPAAKGRKATKKASMAESEPAQEQEVLSEPQALVEDEPMQEKDRTPEPENQRFVGDLPMSDADALNAGDFSEPPLRNTTPIFSPQPPSPALSSPTPARHSSARNSSAKRTSHIQILQRSPSAPGTPHSPQSSDAENKPPSSRPSIKRPPLFAPQQVSQKENEHVTRVPLATGTPTASPTKRLALAGVNGTRTPGGRNVIANLKSAAPWTAVDLEDVLLATPVRNAYLSDQGQQDAKALAMRDVVLPSGGDKENADNRALLREVASRVKAAMSKEERGMTVEEWIKFHAARGEDRLRRECEALVGVFEREGLRAMVALEGVEATS